MVSVVRSKFSKFMSTPYNRTERRASKLTPVVGYYKYGK